MSTSLAVSLATESPPLFATETSLAGSKEKPASRKYPFFTARLNGARSVVVITEILRLGFSRPPAVGVAGELLSSLPSSPQPEVTRVRARVAARMGKRTRLYVVPRRGIERTSPQT